MGSGLLQPWFSQLRGQPQSNPSSFQVTASHFQSLVCREQRGRAPSRNCELGCANPQMRRRPQDRRLQPEAGGKTLFKSGPGSAVPDTGQGTWGSRLHSPLGSGCRLPVAASLSGNSGGHQLPISLSVSSQRGAGPWEEQEGKERGGAQGRGRAAASAVPGSEGGERGGRRGGAAAPGPLLRCHRAGAQPGVLPGARSARSSLSNLIKILVTLQDGRVSAAFLDTWLPCV